MFRGSRAVTLDTGGTRLRMSHKGTKMKRDFDVVVIGAGVAGGMVAYRLAKAGARVLILEAGNGNPTRAEMVGAYATANYPKALHSPFVQAESDAKAPSPDSSTAYLVQPSPPPFKSTYERRTGG